MFVHLVMEQVLINKPLTSLALQLVLHVKEQVKFMRMKPLRKLLMLRFLKTLIQVNY